MTKRALVILAEGFEDVEAVTAVDILRRAGVEVTVAGLTAGLVKGARGTAVQPDTPLDAVAGGTFDALILPGGGLGAKNLASSAEVGKWLRRFHSENRLIAAICAAPAVVLAPAGVLDGRRATCFPGMEDRFPPTARHVAEPVVVDGNLITSRALGTALAFSLAVVEILMGARAAAQIRQAVLA